MAELQSTLITDEKRPPLPPSRRSKKTGTAAPIGSGPEGETCKSCKHYGRVKYHDYVHLKCLKMRHEWTHGTGTDIKASYAACKEWEKSDA